MPKISCLYDFLDRDKLIFTKNFTILRPDQTEVLPNDTGNYIIPCTGHSGKGDTMLVIQEVNFEDGATFLNKLELPDDMQCTEQFYIYFVSKLGYKDETYI